MKKVLSAILTITMLMTCVFSTFITPVSAATDVSVDASSLESVIEFLDDNMPDSSNQRIEVFDILSTYLKTDTGIDTLIGVLDGTVDPVPNPIQIILNVLESNGADIDTVKDEFIFALSLVKALDDNVVEDGIDAFEAFRAETEANGGTEEEYIVSQAELNELYEALVGLTGRDKLAVHNVGPNSIVLLVEMFDGYILLTDDKVGGDDFAVKKVSSSYDDSAFDYIDALNGTAVSDAEDVIEVIVAEVNDYYSASEKETLKVVLEEIGLYTPLKKTTTSSSSSSRPGFVIPSATPTEEPTQDPSYEEVGEGLIIEEPAEGNIVFSDTENHWSKNYISALAEDGIFNGRGDGSFAPEIGITREEVAVVLVRILGVESQLGTVALKQYNDVTEISAWARESVALTTKLGIFEGYDDGYFRPSKVVSREELCAVLIRAMEDDVNKVLLNYADRASFAEWSTPYIGKASYLGIVKGYPDGEFKPTQQVTRAEAAKIIYNYIQIR